jgi:hypothetical protein
MRGLVARERLLAFMRRLALGAPRGASGQVYLVGGATAVWLGWRASTIDIDLHGEPDRLFANIQEINDSLGLNVEFARPEDFVPPLAGSADRHVFIEEIGHVSFFHHDPYAQAFAKIVRGFDQDLKDAERFVTSGLLEPRGLQDLVHEVPKKVYAKYPALSREAMIEAIDAFVHAVP